jgi:hypothetical protein
LPDELQTDVVSEIARLTAAIGRESASTDRMLNDHPSAGEDDYPRWGVAEHRELNRQLVALDQCVARARSRGEDRLLLRAELATLLSFAKTLWADAEAWRQALPEGLREFERQRAAARAESERLAAESRRLAAERAALVQRRDALRWQIDQTARRMAQDSGGECRPTLPVFRFGDDLSVCSVSIKSPRRGFRPGGWSLVTLNETGDEVVVRRS